MIVFDTRMVSGFPLHYYQPLTSFYTSEISSKGEYYRYCNMADISEEFMIPRSPDSNQVSFIYY